MTDDRGPRLGEWLLGVVARLPFRWLLWLGSAVGTLIFFCSRRTRERILDNVRRTGVSGSDPGAVRPFAHRCAGELGKSLTEVLPLWFGRSELLLSRIRVDPNWDAVRALATAGKGAIFLTPHLGAFELAGQFLAHHFIVTLMYRPPRIAWLDPLIRRGRTQGRAAMTTADTRGVRALLKALRRGEAIGLLPDQVPAQGHGVRVDFFGQPAYTSTLIGKLQRATGAPIIFMCMRRLPGAQGYELKLDPVPETLPPDDEKAARTLNAIQEDIIRRCPEQYLWTYNRYKPPVAAPAAALAAAE